MGTTSQRSEEGIETIVQPEWNASQMGTSTAPAVAPAVEKNAPGAASSAEDPSKPSYAASPYAARDYTALRGIANLCRILSWIAVGLAALQALGGLWVMTNSFLLGLTSVIAAIVGGGLLYILLQVVAESISVMLDIEANTRRAAVLLEQRLSRK